MTGPEHYRAAEDIVHDVVQELAHAVREDRASLGDSLGATQQAVAPLLAAAAVHAQLAHVALLFDTAGTPDEENSAGLLDKDYQAWPDTVGRRRAGAARTADRAGQVAAALDAEQLRARAARGDGRCVVSGLVVTRRIGEVLLIGDDIRVVVESVQGAYVSLRVEAPREVRVDRAEVRARKDAT